MIMINQRLIAAHYNLESVSIPFNIVAILKSVMKSSHAVRGDRVTVSLEHLELTNLVKIKHKYLNFFLSGL